RALPRHAGAARDGSAADLRGGVASARAAAARARAGARGGGPRRRSARAQRGRAMSDAIHPSAIIDPRARLEAGVRVGAFSVIGPEVTLKSFDLVCRLLLEKKNGAVKLMLAGSVLGVLRGRLVSFLVVTAAL